MSQDEENEEYERDDEPKPPREATLGVLAMPVEALIKHIFHFSAVSTGIHKCRTACRAGNAVSKFKP